jgi:holo-[acyl-carrier protein] synthase
MIILGHGIDIIDLEDFEALLSGSGEHLCSRCFTDRELEITQPSLNRPARLAARFAAKEAVLKSLGTGWVTGISWKDIEVVTSDAGVPSVLLKGEVARVASARGVTRFHVSLSHSRRAVVASVIAEGPSEIRSTD